MIDLSPIQILIVLAIALIVFGPRRLPELAKSVGKGVKEFKTSISMDAPPSPPARTTAQVTPPPASRDIDDDDPLDGVIVPGDDQPPGAR